MNSLNIFNGMANQYAQSFFELAQKESKLVLIQEDVRFFLDLIKVKEFMHFLETPFVASLKKQAFLTQTLKNKINPLTFHFLLLLERKKELHLIPLILNRFTELYNDVQGIIKVMVTTAKSLNEHQKGTIVNHLKEKFKKEIRPQWQVNPRILGGLKIQKQDVIFDYSFNRQLEKFEKDAVNL